MRAARVAAGPLIRVRERTASRPRAGAACHLPALLEPARDRRAPDRDRAWLDAHDRARDAQHRLLRRADDRDEHSPRSATATVYVSARAPAIGEQARPFELQPSQR